MLLATANCGDNRSRLAMSADDDVDSGTIDSGRSLDAVGLLFFGGNGAPPAFVPNHNTSSTDVPLSFTVTGAFFVLAAPLSDALVPGLIHVYASILDAAGTRELGHTEQHNVVTFDESGWSSSSDNYLMIGGCYMGQFLHLEPTGPFLIRMEAVDEAQTKVRAEVLVQPSCALANGSSEPRPIQTFPELCVQSCPGF